MDPKQAFVRLLIAWLVFLATLTGGCAGSLTSQISRSIGHATDYLADRQSHDGAWRSEVYKDMEDGVSLTPTVCKALVFGGTNQRARKSAKLGMQYVVGLADASGPKVPMAYPVYDGAAAVLLLTRAGQGQSQACQSFVRLLRQHQLGPEAGWSPTDPQFGGWGYSSAIPYKPKRMELWNAASDSNLSSTLFALGALRMTTTPDDPAVQAGLEFALRCQNYNSGDIAFDDGGFFASPTFGPLNKAGGAGTDRQGRTRYVSYGSATADGMRCLLRAGYPPDHPRVAAARAWLERNFSAQEMPGQFPNELETERDSLYYYWCWSLAHAMNDFERAGGLSKLNWAEPMARELLARQLDSGCWKNQATASREDDPLVATPFAMAALSLARQKLVGKGGASGSNPSVRVASPSPSAPQAASPPAPVPASSAAP